MNQSHSEIPVRCTQADAHEPVMPVPQKRWVRAAVALMVAVMMLMQPVTPLSLLQRAAWAREELLAAAVQGFIHEEQVFVLFEPPLDEATVPPVEAFSVEGEVPVSAFLAAGQLLLTLAEPVDAGEPRLHYAPFEERGLKRDDGSMVEPFSLVLTGFGQGDEAEPAPTGVWEGSAVEVETMGPSSVTIAWEPDPQASAYQVRVASPDEAPLMYQAPRPRLEIRELAPDTTYELSVMAIHDDGEFLDGPALAFKTPPQEGGVEKSPASPSQWVVGFEPRQEEEGAQFLEAEGFEIVYMLSRGGAVVESQDEAISSLALHPAVRYVEPNYMVSADAQIGDDDYPNDPRHQWALQHNGIRLFGSFVPYGAWERVVDALEGAQEKTVVVAVIDTGVDYTHEDLEGRILPGHNILTGQSGWDAAQDDSQEGHGTRIAGILAAATNNEIGMAGVAGEFPVYVLPIKALDAEGEGDVTDIAQAIDWALDWEGEDGEKVSIINLSFGMRMDSEPTVLKEAIDRAVDREVLMFASGGQDDSTVEGYYPAAFPGVLSVAGLSSMGYFLDDSNSGTDLAAPGRSILSTIPNHEYATASGVSYAVPHASGAAALMQIANPGASYQRQVDVLLHARDEHDVERNRRMLRADQAIKLVAFDPLPPPVVLTAGTDTVVRLYWEEVEHVVEYVIERDGQEVATVMTEHLEEHLGLGPWFRGYLRDEGLAPDTEYRYDIRSVDIFGRVSEPYSKTVRTQPPFHYATITTHVSVPDVSMPESNNQGGCNPPAISGDGRYVVFSSYAVNLVPEDTDWSYNIFMHDRHARATTLISVTPEGEPGNRTSEMPGVSENARFVVFQSRAANLGPTGIYVWDRETGELSPLGLSTEWYPSISDDGRYVAYRRSATVYLYDRDANQTGSFDEEDGTEEHIVAEEADYPSLSSCGRYVAFQSEGAYGDGVEAGVKRAYRYDREEDVYQLASVSTQGEENQYDVESVSLSPCGRFVIFDAPGFSRELDSRYEDYRNGVYLRDMEELTTELASVTRDGAAAAYGGFFPRVSRGGRFVSFFSYSGDLSYVEGAEFMHRQGLFVRDRESGELVQADLCPEGEPANDSTFDWAYGLSARGLDVAFATWADNLVPGLVGHNGEVFVTSLSHGVPVWPEGSSLSALQVGGTFVELGWSEAVHDIGVEAYRIYQDGQLLEEMDGSVHQYAVMDLEPGTEYSFQVQAGTAAGQWTTAGPQLNVYTPTDMQPGEAGLFIEALSGGRAILTWAPAAPDVSISGYRVVCSPGQADEVVLGDVDADVRTYTDDGLLANTAYSYRVYTLDGEEMTEHTVIAEVTTLPLFIVRARWSSDDYTIVTQTFTEEAVIDATLLGEPSRLASLRVEYESHVVEDGQPLLAPVIRTVTGDLVETEPLSGDYRGSLTLPLDVVEVTDVRAILRDGGVEEIDARAYGPFLPIPVEGGLEVTIDSFEGTLQGDRLTVYSSQLGRGNQITLDGPGAYHVGGLPAADDYRVRIINQEGRILTTKEDVTVWPGTYTPLTLIPRLRVELRLRALEPERNDPVAGVRLIVRDAETDEFLGWSTTDESGQMEPLTVTLSSGDELKVWARSIPFPYDQHEPALIPFGEQESDIILDWHPEWENRAFIQGYVRDEDDLPMEGVTVTATSGWRSTRTVESTVTGADGSYEVEAVAGAVTMMASLEHDRADHLWAIEDVSLAVEHGQQVDMDLTLYEVRRYFLWLEQVSMLYPGQEEPTVIAPVQEELASELNLSWRLSDREASRWGWLVRNTRLRHGGPYPMELWAPAGVRLFVNVDGRDIGLPAQTREVVLGDDPILGVMFDLEHRAVDWGSITGRIMAPDGELWPEAWWGRIGGESIAGDRYSRTLRESGPGEFTIYVPDTGSYRLDINYRHESDLYSVRLDEIAVTKGEETHVGDLTPAMQGAFSGRVRNSVGAVPSVLAPGGSTSIRAQYRNAFDFTAQDVELVFQLPDSLSLIEETVTHDGQAVDFTLDGDVLTVPVGDAEYRQQRAVRFQLGLDGLVEDDLLPNLPVDISYRDEHGMVHTETLGTVFLNVVSDVTLQAPELVHNQEIYVHGRAPGDSEVRLYHEDVLLGVAEVAPNGFWRLHTTLPEVREGEWRWYYLQAVAQLEDREFFSPVASVLYDNSQTQPRVTFVRFRQVREAWPEMDSHAAGFPASFEWEEFATIDGALRFPRQMLAGWPFEFEIFFCDPDAVENVRAGVEGPAGGETAMVKGEDGVFRGTTETLRRGVTWRAGTIYVLYDSVDPPFPQGGHTVVEGELQFPGDEDWDLLTADQTLQRYSAAVPFEAFGGHLNANMSVSIEPGHVGTVDDRMDVESLSYSASGNNISLTVRGYVPLSTFTSQDQQPPVWPDDSHLVAVDMGADWVQLEWDAASDNLWVDGYRIYQGDDLITSVGGGTRTYTLSGLTSGDYRVSVEAYDAAGNSSLGPALTFTAGDTEVVLSGEGLETFRIESSRAESEQEVMLRAAAPGGRVFSALRFTGVYGGPAADVLIWAEGALNLKGRFDALDALVDDLADCVPEHMMGVLEHQVGWAKETLVVSQILQTCTVTVSLGALASGVGALGGLGVAALGGTVTWLMHRETRQTQAQAREEYERLKDLYDCDDPEERDPERRQDVADPGWKIDPSGFVYEVVEDNRLAGVTTTVMHSSDEEGTYEVWDADWWGEFNPQVTGIDGRYGWDVPPDWWMVMYEKDGYETTFSDALPVPPPHFDVDIPMKSLSAPCVTEVDGALDGEAIAVTFSRYMETQTLNRFTLRVFATDEYGDEVEGTVQFPSQELVSNPHVEGDELDLSLRAWFVPDETLPIGEEYEVWVSGIAESYAEIPMGEDFAQTVVILNAYEIEVDVEPEGTGSVTGDGTYADGAQATLEAEPAWGYAFSHWSEGGEFVTDAPVYTFEVRKHRQMVAHFQVARHTLTIEDSPEGTVSPPPGSYEYDHGTVVELSATPHGGWRFSSWTGPVAERKAAETTILMSEDAVVRANYRCLDCLDPVDPPTEVTPPAPPTDEWTVEVPVGEDFYAAFDQGRFGMFLPAGALEAPGTLTVRRIPQGELPPLPEGATLLGGVYQAEVRVDGQRVREFPQAIQARYRMEDGDSPDPMVFYWDEALEQWLAFPSALVLVGDEIYLAGSTVHLTWLAGLHDPGFPDLGDIMGHWAENYILKLASLGVVDGYGDGTFRPERGINRAEFAKLMVESLGMEAIAWENPFTDHLPSWAGGYILAAVEAGLFTGYEDGTFRPGQELTRQEMAAVLVRAMGAEPKVEGALDFTDAETIASWAVNYVRKAVALKLLTGHEDGRFDPDGTATRAQSSAVFWRVVDGLFR